MLSIKQCRNILNKNETQTKYTDQEVKQVRTLLYKLAELDYQTFTKKMNEDEKRNNIHKGKHRRASR